MWRAPTWCCGLACAFLGASVEVTLSGFATAWDDTTTLGFGDGVTVRNVRVASPTALIATLDVASTAALGVRDVTVSTGASALTYKKGFGVGSPIAVEAQGDVAQGSSPPTRTATSPSPRHLAAST